MITVAGIIVIAVVALVAKSLLAEEIRGCIDQLPAWMLRRAAGHLPPGEEDTLTGAWLPDLAFEQHKAEGRPLTRLFIGIFFGRPPARSRRQWRRGTGAGPPAAHSYGRAQLTATVGADTPDTARQVHVRRLSAYPRSTPTENLPPAASAPPTGGRPSWRRSSDYDGHH